MLNLLKFFTNKRKIKFKARLWKTDKCYKCGENYDKNSFWAQFEEINGVVWQVPICDKCSGTGISEAPHL